MLGLKLFHATVCNLAKSVIRTRQKSRGQVRCWLSIQGALSNTACSCLAEGGSVHVLLDIGVQAFRGTVHGGKLPMEGFESKLN